MLSEFIASADPTLATLAGTSWFILVLVYIRYLASWKTPSRGLSPPPGPRPFPIIGNLLDWPKANQWATFRDLGIKYGDVLYLKLLNQDTVVLGSPKAITEFLNKKSANTSDRPSSAVSHLTGLDINFSGMPYGQQWRRHKRTFWQHFHPGALPAYQQTQCHAAHRFLRRLLEKPSKLREHIRFAFTTAIVKVLFDIDVSDENDEMMDIVEAALAWTGEVFTPGKYLVEVLPILKYVPPWIPGATLQRLSVYYRYTIARLKDVPYGRARGEGADCVVGKLIRKMISERDGSATTEEENIIKNVAAVSLEGALRLYHMFSTVQTVFVAMSRYPEVLKKAQAELDAVLGPNRLPEFSDTSSLVYVNAVIKEALRWQVVVPFSLPHMTTEDDVFRGYFIPAGTVIMPNVSACMHDPNIYEDPYEFRPERFIHNGRLDFSSAPDPASFVFGFGRRICPGRYFAENGLFINVASVLHVFDITPPVDDQGNVIDIVPQVTDGLLCYPVDCRCTIQPRSAEARALVQAAQTVG
ncbi:cytochrome P450 [Dichomitus squalens LYAD-421 SS1]|uniref:Cytochrome P450 n=1 Tax=Dichomitus squalens (strain LYAD-421) TaxID=732165 RepID=R7SM57_DICSQ|nr:cytochrome P450 [Dichomitus squalens LYAD-421 SS1]EJF57201.1 cytochrome P450 [Dichomitus squalens LYAD-421 SS1]